MYSNNMAPILCILKKTIYRVIKIEIKNKETILEVKYWIEGIEFSNNSKNVILVGSNGLKTVIIYITNKIIFYQWNYYEIKNVFRLRYIYQINISFC